MTKQLHYDGAVFFLTGSSNLP